jgi:hypothetical protein
MSGDVLRSAASVLRERAGACDGWYTAEAWATTAPFNLPIEPADAAYIATMHPLVGLALADLLDREAAFAEHEGVPAHVETLAVARAVLGESA